MARKVTVTFDNGAQHTYEDVPDSATPESVLERTRRDFGERGVTNIDGGREKGGLDYVMDLGKSAASLADTGLNAVTGALDYGAYALARAAGRSPEQAQAETTSPKDVIGSAFGITQDPAYQQEASRRAMGAVGAGIEKYAVKPISSATGLPEQDVANMVNTGMIAAAPAVARGAQATGRAAVGGAQSVGRGAAEVVRAPANFGRGFVEGVLNPEPTPNSAMVPLQKQAYPAQAGREFMAGNMSLPELEASRVPSASLFSGRLDQAALKALPTNAAKQPMVPLAGRGMEAVGENLGRGYRTQPLQAAADLGLISLGVPPIGPAARAAQGLASLRASKAADFSPGFTQQLGAAQSQAALAPNTQLRLPAPATPSPGPVDPATMYAGAGGVSSDIQQAGQAALQQKYTPQPATTQQAVQQAAAARVQGMPQVVPQRRGPPGVISMIPDDDLIRPVDESAAGAVAPNVTVMTPEKLQMWRDYKTKTEYLKDGSVIKTYPMNESGTITATDKIMPDTGYGEQIGRSVRNKDVGLYNEMQRGPDIIQREVQVPGMTITETNGFEYKKGKQVPTRTVQVRQGNQTDYYENGKVVESVKDGLTASRPVNKTMPDIESWIRKIKGE